MPSAFTPLLRLTLPADGELVGTWGQIVNSGITSLEETAIAGTAVIAMADANQTLTTSNGAADQARANTLRCTGVLTAQRTVTCPSSSKNYFVRNATTGGFGVLIKTAAGAGVVVPAGAAMLVYCDGVDVVQAVNYSGSDSFADGTSALPGIAFAAELGTGFWRSATKVGLSQGGVIRQTWENTFSNLFGSFLDFDDNFGIVWGTTVAGAAAFTGSSAPSFLGFNTSNAEKARFDAAGNFLVGATTPIHSTAAVRLQLGNAQASAALTVKAGSSFTHLYCVDAGPTFNSYVTWSSSGTLIFGAGDAAATTFTEAARIIPAIGIVIPNNAGFTWGNFLTSNTYIDGDDAVKRIRFAINGSFRVTLDGSGNLGLGVTPSAWSAATKAIETPSGAISATSTAGMSIGFNTYVNATPAYVYKVNGAASSFEQFGGAFTWLNAPVGVAAAVATMTERMRLDVNGDFYLNTTTLTGKMSLLYPRATRHGIGIKPDADTGVGNAIIFQNAAGTQVGAISTTSVATTYATSSDARLKTDIVPAPNVGDVIDALQVRQFEFIAEPGNPHIGFIAQELNDVAPDTVQVGGDDPLTQPWGVDLSKLVPLLVRELQSLRVRVAMLGG